MKNLLKKTLFLIILGSSLNAWNTETYPKISNITTKPLNIAEVVKQAFNLESLFEGYQYSSENNRLTFADNSFIEINFAQNSITINTASKNITICNPDVINHEQVRSISGQELSMSEAEWRILSIVKSTEASTTKRFFLNLFNSTTTQFSDNSQIITNPESNFILVINPKSTNYTDGTLLDKNKPLQAKDITLASDSEALNRIKSLSEFKKGPLLKELIPILHSNIYHAFKSSKIINYSVARTSDYQNYDEKMPEYYISNNILRVPDWRQSLTEYKTSALAINNGKYFIARKKSEALLDLILVSADFSEIKNNELHLYFEESNLNPLPSKLIFNQNGNITIDFLNTNKQISILFDRTQEAYLSFKEITKKKFDTKTTSSSAFKAFFSAAENTETCQLTDFLKKYIIGWQEFSLKKIWAPVTKSINLILSFDEKNDAVVNISNNATSIEINDTATTLLYQDNSFIEVVTEDDGSYTIKTYDPDIPIARLKAENLKTFADFQKNKQYSLSTDPEAIMPLASRAIFIAMKNEPQIKPKSLVTKTITTNKIQKKDIALSAGAGAAVGGAIVGGGFAIKKAINFYKSKTLSPATINNISRLTAFCVETDDENTIISALSKTKPVIQTSKITNTSYAVFTGSPNGDWKFVVESLEQQGIKLVRTPNPKAENFVLKLKLDKNNGKAETTFSFETYFTPAKDVNQRFRTGATYAKYAMTPWFINKKTGKKYALIITTNNESLESITAAVNENV